MVDKVTLEAGGETLDLNEISVSGKGVQAVSGMTGLGLPPVDVQWVEGLGDGARARSMRVQMRDMDIPLHVVTDTKADLKTKLSKIARVTSQPMILKVWDGTDYVWTEVVRVGGGEYATGSMGNPDTEWSAVLTVRAGDPFWKHAASNSASSIYTIGTTVHDFTLVNNGSAEAWPTITLDGPLDGATFTHLDTGETFSWTGRLNADESLVIDTESADATDQTGVNRYAGLSYAPEFFALRPGSNSIRVTIVPVAGGTVTRYNIIEDPEFTDDPTFARWVSATGGAGRDRAALTDFGLRVGTQDVSSSGGFFASPAFSQLQYQIYNPISAGSKMFRMQVRGDNASVRARVDVYLREAASGDNWFSVGSYQHNGGDEEVVFEFTATAASELYVAVLPGRNTAGPSLYTQIPIEIGKVYLGGPGGFFSGDSTDNALTSYTWVDDAAFGHISKAETIPAAPGAEVAITERDWMVV